MNVNDYSATATEVGSFCICCGIRSGLGHLTTCTVHPGSIDPGELPQPDIRFTQLVVMPWKDTALLFGLDRGGKVYRQAKRGWVAVPMNVVVPKASTEY
jgi:hypothetical protein